VLSVPDGGRELVARRAGGAGSRRLGSITLRQTRRGRFVSREAGRRAPRIRLKLTPRGRRAVAYDLTVANVAIPRLPEVCGHGLASLRLTPRPFALKFRLRVLRPGRRPVSIAGVPNFACRYARSGAVRGLRVAQPPRAPEPGRSLSLRLRQPRRLTVGERGTLRVTVRNRTSKRAHDVYVYAVVPRGLQVVGSSPRARITRRQVAWRIDTLRRHRSRTLRLRVVPRRSGAALRCGSVHARAVLRRPARATACIGVAP
jgi:uncharacterized repeat protein (TIGR01451 family)